MRGFSISRGRAANHDTFMQPTQAPMPQERANPVLSKMGLAPARQQTQQLPMERPNPMLQMMGLNPGTLGAALTPQTADIQQQAPIGSALQANPGNMPAILQALLRR